MIRDNIKGKGEDKGGGKSEGRSEGGEEGRGVRGGRILTFDIPDVCSASLIPGRSRPINGRGGDFNAGKIGDSVYIDLNLGIVAVADGPERNPSASSVFIKKLRAAIHGSPNFGSPPRIFSESLFKGAFEELVETANVISKGTDYHNATTFSALFTGLRDEGEGGSAGRGRCGLYSAILHTGDSMIFKISAGTGEVSRLTKTNHFLIGRAPRLFQAEFLSEIDEVIEGGDTVLLSTDGLNDLARSHGITTEDFLAQEIVGLNPRGITRRIGSLAGGAKIRLDDIGLVCLVPGAAICRHLNKAVPGIILEDAVG
ncbi:MAG: hypothetical protein JW984_05930 [Deltaproteobacteria bacterium]|uniref:PPM-type phosphatase domain-containing protein n=1 Tax=Candidatus Zymogenus saltonus TaxID=2844893 RepID=A0A9D8KDY8_9DELT|nr:hypothetical protein [Candidatus Zymogenus saltonus]